MVVPGADFRDGPSKIQPAEAVLAAMAIGPTDEELMKVEKDLGWVHQSHILYKKWALYASRKTTTAQPRRFSRESRFVRSARLEERLITVPTLKACLFPYRYKFRDKWLLRQVRDF